MQSLCQYSCYAFVSNKHHVERHWWWILTFISCTRAHTNRFECRLCWWRWRRRRRLRRQWWRWRRHQYTQNDEKQKKIVIWCKWLVVDYYVLTEVSCCKELVSFVHRFPLFVRRVFVAHAKCQQQPPRIIVMKKKKKKKTSNKKQEIVFVSSVSMRISKSFSASAVSVSVRIHFYSLQLTWFLTLNCECKRREANNNNNAKCSVLATRNHIGAVFFPLFYSFRFFCGLCIYIGYKYYDYIPLRSKIHTYSFSFGIRASVRVCVTLLP